MIYEIKFLLFLNGKYIILIMSKSETKSINPHDILAYRRKIKEFEHTGIQETMKILKTVRQMNLDNKMLRCT